MYGWQRYEKIEEVGRGACGVVYRCRDKEDGSTPHDREAEDSAEDGLFEDVAIKCVPLGDITENEAQSAMTESAILRQLNHPNILRYIDCFIDENNYLCLVTEFVEGGDLSVMVNHGKRKLIDALVVSDIMSQLLTGLAYLYENGVVHRDIKPANVYITQSGTIKIGDFGVSTLLSQTHSKAKTFIGTPLYLCPEVCKGEPYGHGADVWSCGIMMYELYCGKLPFNGRNIMFLIEVISTGKYDRATLRRRPFSAEPEQLVNEQFQRQVCNMIVNVIEAALKTNPSERPTAGELLQRYCNPNATNTAGTDVTTMATCGDSLPPIIEDEEVIQRRISDLMESSSQYFSETQRTANFPEDDDDDDDPLIIMNDNHELPAPDQPLFLSDVQAGENTPLTEAAALSRTSTIHQRPVPTTTGIVAQICRWSNCNPAQLEARIRKRAVINHRQRQAEQSRKKPRDMEHIEKVERLMQEREAKARSEPWSSPLYLSNVSNTSTGGSPKFGSSYASPKNLASPTSDLPVDDEGFEATQRAQERARLRDSCKPLNLRALTTETLKSSMAPNQEPAAESPFKKLLLQRPDLMASVRKMAVTIVENEQKLEAEEKQKQAAAVTTLPKIRRVSNTDGIAQSHANYHRRASVQSTATTMTMQSNSNETDETPLLVNVVIIARHLPRTGDTVAVKCTTGTGFKKLKRKLLKSLGIDPDEQGPFGELPGELMYMDAESDLVKVVAGRDWRHVLEDHQKRKGGHALHMRLV